ncbi:MAG: hypothetical protein R6T85_08280 [Egibacteraceae bacterium]
MAAAPRGRQRALQLGLLLAAVAVVVVADRTASALARAIGSGVASALLSVGGHVVGGWALGLALRLQLARASRPDPRARLVLGVPTGLLAALPMGLAVAPEGLVAALPGWLLAAQVAAPFAGVALGVVLALAVVPSRR